MSSHAQVLSVIFRMGGKQFAAATQLLAAGTGGQASTEAAASSMAEALAGTLPDLGQAVVKKDKETFQWKEFRAPTKHLLCGLANALQQGLPDGFTLRSARPANLLRPCGPHGCRLKLTSSEIKAHNLGDAFLDKDVFFCHDYSEQTSWLDCYTREDFYHLALVADEGTEA